MTTEELLATFWREYERHHQGAPPPADYDGFCQCQTEPFFEGCQDPMLIRAVLLVSDLIVQCLGEFGIGRDVDRPDLPPSRFPIPYRLAYVVAHAGSGGGPIGWVLRGYDGNPVRMKWKLATTVAGTMVGSIREWMEAEPERAALWPTVSDRLQAVLSEVWANDPFARSQRARAWGLLPPNPRNEMFMLNEDPPSRALEEVLMPRVLGGLAEGWDASTSSRDVARMVERVKRAARLAADHYSALDGGRTGYGGERGPFADALGSYLRQGQMPSRAVELALHPHMQE